MINPIDCHVHLREGKMLRMVAPYTAKYFKTAIVMPNLVKPVSTIARVERYRKEITQYFQPLMTMYFDVRYTMEMLIEARSYIKAIKMYPKGLTTNSDHGVDLINNAAEINGVLAAMEELKIPLCVHAETVGYHEDREMLCVPYIKQWSIDFPLLKIIIEHISDRRTLSMLDLEGIYATITPQHLLLTGDDFVGPPLNVHNYCLPVCKRPEDRKALYEAVTGDYKDKVMMGTDSAPHLKGDKITAGCAGVFNSPIALLAVAQVFDNDSFVMQRFCSENAIRVHGLTMANDEDMRVEIEQRTFKVPKAYNKVFVPLMAGKTLSYSYVETASH